MKVLQETSQAKLTIDEKVFTLTKNNNSTS